MRVVMEPTKLARGPSNPPSGGSRQLRSASDEVSLRKNSCNAPTLESPIPGCGPGHGTRPRCTLRTRLQRPTPGTKVVETRHPLRPLGLQMRTISVEAALKSRNGQSAAERVTKTPAVGIPARRRPDKFYFCVGQSDRSRVEAYCDRRGHRIDTLAAKSSSPKATTLGKPDLSTRVTNS